MASRLLRRSGVAVGLVAEVLGWRADWVYQVGVGHYHQEADVLLEEWPGVKFIGFEPHPELAKEPYPGVVHQVAISDRIGSATLYAKKYHKDGSSLFPLTGMDRCRMIEVPVSTLDFLFPEPPTGRILLWLDCEGSELDALRGGEKFVKRVDVVNVEITANPLGEAWCSPKSIHDWLLAKGFVRQWIHTQRIHSGQYDGIYCKRELFKPEFCCDP